MVDSGFDEAWDAVSAREAGAGPANEGWAIDPTAYRSAEDLSQRPTPASPWVINEQAVPPGPVGRPKLVRVRVQLWVSDQGHIDAIQLLDADPVVPWLEALLKDLDKTPLKPAFEGGRPVASSWQVELQLDLDNPF